MKFALFAATALAASIVQRDAATLESDISAIQSATTNLDSAIKAITGPSSKSAVLAANSALLSAINKGTADAKASQPLTQTEALGIATPIGNLASQVSTAINDLIAKKSLIVSSGLGGTTESQLLSVQSASEAFSSDVTALVPTLLQSTAQELSGQILSALASGVAAFKGLSDSTGSGSSSSAAAPTTSTAAPTTAASSATSAASSATSAVSSAASSVSSVISSASSAVSSVAASSSAVSYPTGNSTSSPTPSSTPYSGSATSNVVSFGGLVAAAVAVVAAL